MACSERWCMLTICLTIAMCTRVHPVRGKLVCVCSTPACNAAGRVTCKAVTSCYTQYLDRGDDSPPVTRGCIDETTPLLCENRKPFVPVTPWPHLQCCKNSMCNKDTGVVTAPTWPKKTRSQSTTTKVFQLQNGSSRHRNHDNQPSSDESLPINNRGTSSNQAHPAFLVVLPITTVCLLLMLLAVVVVAIRQSRSRRSTQHHSCRTGDFRALNVDANGLPVGNGRASTFYSTGDPYIREKFFSSVPV